MREIKESTYNAIKSRNMTGANSFKHKIMIDGEPVGYGNVQNSTAVALKNVKWLDFAVRSDGKVVVAYVTSGGEVRISIVESEEELISADYKVPDGTLLTTQTGGPNPLSMIKLKSGYILLFVADLGSPGGTTSIRCYQSSDGLNFTFKSNVYSAARDSRNTWPAFMASITNCIDELDGTLSIAGPVLTSDSGYYMTSIGVFKSVDGGETWTREYTYTSASIWYLSSFLHIKSLFLKDGFWGVTAAHSYGGVHQFLLNKPLGGSWGITNVTGWEKNVSDSSYQYDIRTDPVGDLFVASPTGKLYKAKPGVISATFLNNPLNFDLIRTGMNYYNYNVSVLKPTQSGLIHFLASTLSGVSDSGIKRTFIDSKFKALSINIAKSHGGASTATIQVDNKNGVVNPRNMDGPLYKILNLNKQVIIKQGYGDDLVDSFTGIIDSINMTTFPQLATVSLRDNFKRALDQTVTKDGKNVVKYAHQPIENIVTDLCNLCGLTIGYIEPTGISIATEFNWQSYADAFQLLSDLASFEFLCDESGKFHFRRDFQPGDMQVAWSFEEGVDISNMSYSLNDNDIYKSVRVYGESDGNILAYNAPFLDAAQFNILPQKVLKINATEASTVGELKKIAERAISTMRSRTRVITFTAIAVPHLQTGDFIQIFESSTDTHEIYRLTAITLNMTENSFTMTCTAYYYGDSIVPGELPETTATQTIDPNLNLIPEMTSNTKPSGVARASSVYKDWQAAYSPWRSLNGNDQDFFWDANTRVAWLEYEFPEKTIVDKYVLRARELILYNKAMPKDWTFEAFNGEKWIVLDTRTNQTDWQIYEERAFKFTNTTAYAKYRINITRNNGYVRTQFERLKMYYGGGA